MLLCGESPETYGGCREETFVGHTKRNYDLRKGLNAFSLDEKIIEYYHQTKRPFT